VKSFILDKKTPPKHKEALAHLLVEFQNHSEDEASGSNTDASSALQDANSFIERILSGATSSRVFAGVDDAGASSGFILFTVCAGYGGDWIWLHEVYTRANARKSGNGLQLVKDLMAWGNKQGLKSIVGITDKDNKGVRRMAEELEWREKPLIWLSRNL
jgi:L-amino acid N-acyltransferase YncA